MKTSKLIKPILGKEYKTIEYGKGIYLFDKEGNRYIDGSSGAVTASIGHGVEEVIESSLKQAKKVSFVYRSQFTSEPAEQLATLLNDIFPGKEQYSFFVGSGSEAVETALKLAIQHWQEKGHQRKNKILSRWMSYHGITNGALGVSGYVARRDRFLSKFTDTPSIPAPYYYRCVHGCQNEEECNLKSAKELEIAVKRIGKENIAAFIMEPIVGAAGGALTPTKEYVQEIRRICTENDILLIADEVMTGIGRTGKLFAMEHFDVIPDITTVGKGMSAGYTPIAATLVSKAVLEPILNGSKSIMGGHTYSANPQSTAIALAVMKYILKNHIVENAAEVGNYLKEKLIEFQKESEIIGDVRGKGLMIGLEIVQSKESKLPFPVEKKVCERIVDRAFDKGLLVYPAAAGEEGVNGAAIIISPPLVINKSEIDELLLKLKEAILEIEDELLVKESYL